MKRPAAEALNARTALRSDSHKRQKKGAVAIHWEAVNYLLETYKTDEVIAETDADMVHLVQASNESSTDFANAMWNKALQCHRVYDEYELKGIFLEGLPESIPRIMRSYWGS